MKQTLQHSYETYIGIGANLGQPEQNVKAAIAQLKQLPNSHLIAQSGLYRSAPQDADGDDYINAVVQIYTSLSAPELLIQLQSIETTFGRTRPYWHAPRTMDLDILLYGTEQIDSAILTIPHPHLTQRAFVLLPLLQINPDIHIPGLGAAQDFLPNVATQNIRIL